MKPTGLRPVVARSRSRCRCTHRRIKWRCPTGQGNDCGTIRRAKRSTLGTNLKVALLHIQTACCWCHPNELDPVYRRYVIDRAAMRWWSVTETIPNRTGVIDREEYMELGKKSRASHTVPLASHSAWPHSVPVLLSEARSLLIACDGASCLCRQGALPSDHRRR